MRRLNDKEILKAIRTGDNESVLSNLYKDVLPHIKKYITNNSGSHEDAKDIFQDTVVIFYNQVKLNKFDERKEIGAFMFSVARNLWINKAKRDNRLVNTTEFDDSEEEGTDVLADMITAEKAKAIEDIMDRVGEECKKLLMYTIYDKISLKEIAVKMGYSSDQVAKTYSYRCRQKLFNLVKDNSHIISLFKQ
ncbi:RNA polymerase sigma factor [Sporocytophaga myxococcoides]|uniref:RNA polymerase sigma factor n=1 Tax=Sporocytophaga myxococcoides TaxID=153721 RepID=UPI0004183870|nr:sigma-70 family RNA polymerase sigma factor [Sporocytophaga myxococcoides]